MNQKAKLAAKVLLFATGIGAILYVWWEKETKTGLKAFKPQEVQSMVLEMKRHGMDDV